MLRADPSENQSINRLFDGSGNHEATVVIPEDEDRINRWKEERRGLLSDEIHMDKYPQETLMELTSATEVED